MRIKIVKEQIAGDTGIVYQKEYTVSAILTLIIKKTVILIGVQVKLDALKLRGIYYENISCL